MLVKPLVRPICRAIAGRPTASLGTGFAPTSLFADGSIGVLYDNNDLTTMFVDAAGTTPATVNGLVGLQLDKSQGLVLGAERVINGDFNSDASGWTQVGSGQTIVVTSGVARISSNGLSGGYYQDVSVPNGAWVEVRIRAKKVSGAQAFLWVVPRGDFANPNTQLVVTNTSFQDYVYRVKADATIVRVYIQVLASDAIVDVDSISVKELPGNHRYQTTTGSKPILRGTPTGGNLVTNGDFASGTTGWTASTNGSLSAVSGRMRITNIAANGGAIQGISTVIGGVYRLTISFNRSTINGWISVSNNSNGSAAFASTLMPATGTYVMYFTATAATTYVVPYVAAGVAGDYIEVDDVDLRNVSAGSVTAPYGLQYDGVDDFLQTASVNFSATDKMFVCAGVRKLSDAASACLIEHGVGGANPLAYSLFAPRTAGVGNYGFDIRDGTFVSTALATSFSAPVTNVVSGSFDYSGVSQAQEFSIRLNGASPTVTYAGSAVSSSGFGNYAFYFGRRGGTSAPFNGLDFGFVIVGKTLTAAQISSTERWMAQRTGVSI